LKLIEKYLPEQLSEDEVRVLIQKTIKSTGAESSKDMGRIMEIIMKELSGSADGKMVHNIVHEELNS